MNELISQLFTLCQSINGNCTSDDIFNVKIIATKTGKAWDVNQCTLVNFLTDHTDWQPLTESFFDYLKKQLPGVLPEILIITDDITLADRRHFSKFLKKAKA